MTIAADACIYTNHNFVIEILENTADAPGDAEGMAAPAAAEAAASPPIPSSTKKGGKAGG
jgi:hypothetical protein